jgi:hypothetical protein
MAEIIEIIFPSDSPDDKKRKIDNFLNFCDNLDLTYIIFLCDYLNSNKIALINFQDSYNTCAKKLYENSKKYLSETKITLENMHYYEHACIELLHIDIIKTDEWRKKEFNKDIYYPSVLEICLLVTIYLRENIKNDEVINFLSDDIDVHYGYIPPINLIQKIMKLNLKYSISLDYIIQNDVINDDIFKEVFINFVIKNVDCKKLLLSKYPKAKTSGNLDLFLAIKLKEDKVTDSIYYNYRNFIIKCTIILKCQSKELFDNVFHMIYLCEQASGLYFQINDIRDEKDFLEKLQSSFINMIRYNNENIDDFKLRISKITITDDEIKKEKDISKLYAIYIKVLVDKKKEIIKAKTILSGGIYHRKYLKYKSKYLNLKKLNN